MIPSFQIPPVDEPKKLLDTALSRGAKRTRAMKKPQELHLKVLLGELERLKEIRSSLATSLQHIHDGFPSFDQLSEFTRRVFSLDLDPGRVKQALGAVAGSLRTIDTLVRDHSARMRRCRTESEIVQLRTACLGRLASVMKKLTGPLEILADARAVFRELPTVDDELFTVAIAGFPNVGKSTLLAKLTPAKPEIKPYAFTTKGLNVGAFEYRYNKIQIIDTPGTLDRALPNPIEKKADLTLRYLARAVVYVFDPTEGGYSLAKQRALYEKTKELDKPLMVYISKTDIVDPTVVRNLQKEFADSCTDATEVRARIIAAFREEFS